MPICVVISKKLSGYSCQDATSLAPGHTDIEPRLYRGLILGFGPFRAALPSGWRENRNKQH